MSLCSLVMMYIFRWGMIHSAVASIYNCHWPTWVRQTDVSLQADRERDSLLNRDTVFLISFTNHFPSNGSSLQSLWPLPRCLLLPLTPPPSQPSTSHSFSSPAPFLPPICSTKTALKGKMAPSQRRANQQAALLEFLLNFLSMTTPGWQPTHPQIFSSIFFFFPPQNEDHMYSIVITYISPLARKPFRTFFFAILIVVVHVFDLPRKLLKIWLWCFKHVLAIRPSSED